MAKETFRLTTPSVVCNFTKFQDGKPHFYKCPYRNKCEKYNELDPSAVVKAWKNCIECETYREFALKGLGNILEES